MADEPIGERLARMETKIDGINERLDVQNGRVTKTEDEVDKLKLHLAAQRGAIAASRWLIGIACTLIGGAGAVIAERVIGAVGK